MSNQKQTGSTEDKSKQTGGSGNFANDRERASEAGKKGGQHSHDGSSQVHQSGSGRSQQGGGNTDDANDSDDAGSSKSKDRSDSQKQSR
jgi:general stress protein YciG